MKPVLLSPKKHRVVFVVFMNLAGLQETVYKLTHKDNYGIEYWISSDESVLISLREEMALGWNINNEDGYVYFISDKRVRAQEALDALKAYRTFLLSRL